MITLPDFEKSFEYENDFYLSCSNNRLHKFIAHYELFKMTLGVQGDIVECGVFKGASFVRFANFRELFGLVSERKLIGFDTFDTFPETDYADDQPHRIEFIEEAGTHSISREQLRKVLQVKGSDVNVDLIEGDVVKTAEMYVKENPNLKLSFINLDTDVYEPAVAALEQFWPRLEVGGVLVLDDYGVFPGETKAVDDYFKDKNVTIKKLPYAIPSYIIKE